MTHNSPNGRWRHSMPEGPSNESPWPIGFARPGSELPSTDPKGLLVNTRPISALQALMEAAPGDEPVESVEEQNDLRDVLADALDHMDPRYRWVLQAKVNRGMSFAHIANELNISKTHAHHLYHKARAQLADLLDDEPVVQRRLK